MKREIKFRGKSIRSVWVYGDLLHYTNPLLTSPNNHGAIIVTDYKSESDNKFKIIAPDTVGQYTGLKDKNGKEIYEGDIVYSEFADGSNCMFLVGWNNKLSCFGVMNEYNYRSKQLGYDFPEFDNHLFIEVLKNSKIFKIIGNIHEDKHLLK